MGMGAAASVESRSTLSCPILHYNADHRQCPCYRFHFGVLNASILVDQNSHFVVLVDSCAFDSDVRPDAARIVAWHGSRRDRSEGSVGEGFGAGRQFLVPTASGDRGSR